MIYGLSLMLLGVLSAASFIVSRRPDAKELIEKLAKYQGYFGVVGALWGAWVLVRCVLDLRLVGLPLGLWLTQVAVGAMLLGNGFLLGYNLAMSWLKDEAARAHASQVYQKLLPYQTRLGLAAIVLGAWGVLSSLVVWRL
ncbi:MAG: hypothetical protein RMK29_19820 [Myxococcales bacterium]|nr:hypothetical protein [Myxococcota bacterium]MDW8283957.1 hypothetical protein [Myxococcales bacterium]